uniref:Uncharacterized protein n=1 Tax=Mus spicilegus TaxID=10103 RepID=A0A8C6GSI5_MUSSI
MNPGVLMPCNPPTYSILELLKENLQHYVCIEFDEGLNDTVVYIIGFKFFAIFAMFVIVSLACNLRIKRNRARAWARGLQSPVWWNRRYFI